MNRRSFALALLLVPLMHAPAGAQDAPPVDPTPAPAPEPARVEALERLHDEGFSDERRIMQGLVGGALVSAGAGIALLTRDGDDHAFQVAGGVTLGIAALETAVGAMVLIQNGREQRGWDAARDERRSSIAGYERGVKHCIGEFGRKMRGYRLMLGVDSTIIVAGAASALVSQFGVDHPNRWLAAGLSVALQGVLLLIVDTTGFVQSRRAERSFTEMLRPTASVIVGDGNQVAATVGVAGVF